MVPIGSPRRCTITNPSTARPSGGRGDENTSWSKGNFHVVSLAKMSALGQYDQLLPAKRSQASLRSAALLGIAGLFPVSQSRSSKEQYRWICWVMFHTREKSNPTVVVQLLPQEFTQSYSIESGIEAQSISGKLHHPPFGFGWSLVFRNCWWKANYEREVYWTPLIDK